VRGGAYRIIINGEDKTEMVKMLKKELKRYRELLLKNKERILEGIKHISDDTLKKSQKDAAGDMSGYTLHMADVATDSYDREFSLGLASNDRELLFQVNDALKKIEDGSYGLCQQCTKPITKTRLKAVPFARLCLKCQQTQEKRR